MRYKEKIILILLAISIICIPFVSAMTVTNMSISPSGSALEQKKVTSDFTISLSPSGKYTMDVDRSIQLSTDLENAKWIQKVDLQNVPGPERISYGSMLIIPGWQLAYPIGTNEKVTISLSGLTPNVTESRTINILRATEFNSKDGSIIENMDQYFGKMVINAADIGYMIQQFEKDIRSLEFEINKRNNVNSDLRGNTPAQVLFNQAKEGVEYLKSLRSDEYSQAIERSDEISKVIESAYDAIHRQDVQIYIDKASSQIGNVSQIIEWFANNESTSSYPGLENVTIKYNRAIDLLSQSSGYLESKQWGNSIENAERSFAIATEAYAEAEILQERAKDPLTIIWDNLLIIVLCILGIGMYLLFRKPKNRKKKKIRNENQSDQEIK